LSLRCDTERGVKAAEVNYICGIEKVELRRNGKETGLMVTKTGV